MQTIWLKKWPWFHVPTHDIKFLIWIIAIFFFIPVYGAIFRNGRSVSNDLYHVFVYSMCAAFWWKRITEKRSR